MGGPMSGFSADWLALREPHDRTARNGMVLDAVRAAFAAAPGIAVTDLGCGTGSALRALAPLLPAPQRWRLVDSDPALLATLAALPGVETVALDLAQHLDAALGVGGDLVTTSALLDLVSAEWLNRLIAAVGRRPFYAALSYDGRAVLTPPDEDDAAVIAAVNRHQRTDKGFGPALGPDAARAAVDGFRASGFDVVAGPSDWQFAPKEGAIQAAMIDGWAEAAGVMGVPRPVLAQWLDRRRAHIAAGRSAMRVGHVHFFAVPTGRR
jgi:SAM-dependent methyltransferase